MSRKLGLTALGATLALTLAACGGEGAVPQHASFSAGAQHDCCSAGGQQPDAWACPSVG